MSLSSVQFVLLVGDTENRLEPSNVIPTWYVQDFEGVLASDASYGDRDGDGLADVALGRWPAHNAVEAGVGTSKSIGYDYQSPSQGYRRRWLGFTYDSDNGDVSGDLAREYGDDLFAQTPTGYSVTGVQYRATDLPCCLQPRQDAAVDAINAGAHILWTIGTVSDQHSMSDFLMNLKIDQGCGNPNPSEPIVELFEFSRFDANNACGFWFPLSCRTGGVHQANAHGHLLVCNGPDVLIPPLAEDMLLLPNKGALTWFGPTSLSFPEESHLVGREILSRLTFENRKSVGRVCIDAVKAMVVARPGAVVRASSYIFLGDPTIVMAWGETPTDVAGDLRVRSHTLSVKPNPSRSAFRCQFRLVQDENIALSVYDIAGRRLRTITRGPHRAGTFVEPWDGRDERGRRVATGIYVVRLQTGMKMLSNRIVLIK